MNSNYEKLMGKKFKLKDDYDNNIVYLFCRASAERFCLVRTDTGNRYSDESDPFGGGREFFDILP